ncbi:MAG: DciA family protein [Candidatus Omnitrophota bacterium]|jgi:hypothetical protein
MERMKDVIEDVIRNLTAKNPGNKEADPQEWLKKTLTKKELGHIKFHYFRKGVLGVLVDSSAWMYSLSLKKEALLKKIREYSPGIKAIRLSIGDVQ